MANPSREWSPADAERLRAELAVLAASDSGDRNITLEVLSAKCLAALEEAEREREKFSKLAGRYGADIEAFSAHVAKLARMESEYAASRALTARLVKALRAFVEYYGVRECDDQNGGYVFECRTCEAQDYDASQVTHSTWCPVGLARTALAEADALKEPTTP